VEKLSDGDMFTGMGELPNEKQKIWAKAKFKPEVLFLLKLAPEKEN